MKLSLFSGDLTAAPVEAICTSTNPRLSLMMGTGGAVREAGGFEVLRACEEIVKAELRESGQPFLPVGSAHLTTAGNLPYKAVIHCVASDARHKSSPSVIRACVTNALAAADAAGCSRVGMPVFGTGHAAFPFDKALTIMAQALETADGDHEVVIVVPDRRAAEARKILTRWEKD